MRDSQKKNTLLNRNIDVKKLTLFKNLMHMIQNNNE